MMKKLIQSACWTMLFIFWCLAPGNTANALSASPMSANSTCRSGNYRIMYQNGWLSYQKGNGSRKYMSAQVTGVLPVGKKVYYLSGADNYNQLKFYVYDMQKQKGTHLKTFYEHVELLGYYNNKIYYIMGDNSIGNVTTHCYNVKTKKFTKIKNLDHVGTFGSSVYKNYLLLMGSRGDVSATSFRIYNMKSGRTVKVASDCISCRANRGTVYYIKSKIINYSTGYYFQYTVRKCNLAGKNQKNIYTFKNKENLLPYLGKNYVCYGDTNGNYWKYYFSSKKKVATTRSTLIKLNGGI